MDDAFDAANIEPDPDFDDDEEPLEVEELFEPEVEDDLPPEDEPCPPPFLRVRMEAETRSCSESSERISWLSWGIWEMSEKA